MRFLIFCIFATLVGYPEFVAGGFIVSAPEFFLILGALCLLPLSQYHKRIGNIIFKDYFSFGLGLFTVLAVVLLWQNMNEIRDLNHTRAHSAIPFIAYSFFYVVSHTKSIRSRIFDMLFYSVLFGLLLNYLALFAPNLPIWSPFLLGFNGDSGYDFGKDSDERVQGLIYGNEIFIAVYCGICVLVGQAVYSISTSHLKKFAAVALMVLGMIFLLYTKTRMVCIITCALFAFGTGFCLPLFRRYSRVFNLFLLVWSAPIAVKMITTMFHERSELKVEALRVDDWMGSFGMISDSSRDFLFGTGVHRLYDELGFWHSQNVWLFTAVVYGVPMALAFLLLYAFKFREIWNLFNNRCRLVNKLKVVRDADDIIIYASLLVFLLFLLESFVETTYFQLSRLDIYLYALLGMSRAVPKEIITRSSRIDD